MRHAEILRQALPANLGRIAARDICQLLARRAPEVRFPRKSSPKLGREVESICRCDSRQYFGHASCTQSLLHSFRPLRNHPIGKDIHHLAPQSFIPYGRSQKLLSTSLVQRDSMKLIAAHAPPARQDCTGQKPRYQFSPYQGLNVFWRNKILLHFGKRVRQVCQRAAEVYATAPRWALAK